jgi:GST-like protein
MNRQLADHPYLAGDYSIADMACIGWIKPHKRQGQNLDDYPNLKRWYEAVMARPAVKAGMAVGAQRRGKPEDLKSNDAAHKLLFGKQPG